MRLYYYLFLFNNLETMAETILLLGAGGQIGSELATMYNEQYNKKNVILSDVKPLEVDQESYELDVLDFEKLDNLISKLRPTILLHLPAVLSAKGESIPQKAWQINMQGLLNTLESAKNNNVAKIFYPSSIAVFGNTTPKLNTPQHTINEPTTVYGISKYAGEMWVQYYNEKYNMDIRGLRFPGVISYKTKPGGGTTDYAVDIFYHALQGKKYTCFLNENTRLPMMYMPDALQAVHKLMTCDKAKLNIKSAYNLHSMSFTPAELYNAIKKIIPNIEIEYQPDMRQQIADSWVHSIDDAQSRTDWGWLPTYNLNTMVEDVIQNLTQQLLDK